MDKESLNRGLRINKKIEELNGILLRWKKTRDIIDENKNNDGKLNGKVDINLRILAPTGGRSGGGLIPENSINYLCDFIDNVISEYEYKINVLEIEFASL